MSVIFYDPENMGFEEMAPPKASIDVLYNPELREEEFDVLIEGNYCEDEIKIYAVSELAAQELSQKLNILFQQNAHLIDSEGN